MARRNSNGEGTIYRRKDGRYEGAVYVLMTSGARKRVRVYGATRAEVHAKLTEAKAKNDQGIPAATKSWRLSDYLDYWLTEVVKPNLRPTTYERYETAVRLYLKPGIGGQALTRLTVPIVQTFLNHHLTSGMSVRSVQILREILRSALTRAHEEELVSRNVARLVKLPKWERDDVHPWTVKEAKAFLKAARSDPLYPAFVLLIYYGLRRGEVLGLRWSDIDFENSIIRIRQQVQRVGGVLLQGPVKTRAGRRDLPMLKFSRQVLIAQQQVRSESNSLVFATRNGQPIEPRNFVRSFQRVCEAHDIRRITVHQVRHTTATLLKDLGVPARDAQSVLGHSDIAVTQRIYQHTDMTGRRKALTQVETALRATAAGNVTTQTEASGSSKAVADGNGSRQFSRQTVDFVDRISSILSGRGSRTRTYDTWFWSSIETRGDFHATEVKKAMQVRTRQWVVGIVAVSAAVKNTQANDVDLVTECEPMRPYAGLAFKEPKGLHSPRSR
ncbi:site-specific integrase [Streptomyces sp. PvR018]|uniref:tyrosine-type recombinase/integrase n=1 Tax=Streptomyces sp. PvR018 TaxID=3156442 RepID=UPI00339174E8